MIPALVVGCGAIGSDYDRAAVAGAAPRSHAGSYVASGRTELVGGVDPDPDARQRFAECWGVPTYDSLDAAFAELRPRLVSVCTPPETRAGIVDALLERDVRAIWMEKPLAHDLATGEAIVAACARSGVPLQLNFLRRFDPLHRRVAEAVRGRVLQADFRFSGTLENYGSHAIDLFRWFVGEPEEVEPGAVLQLTTADGRLGTLGRVKTASPLFDCDLWLDDARVSLTAMGEQLVESRPAESTIFPNFTRLEFGSPDPVTGLELAMSSALDALVDHLEHGAPLLCSGADGVAELRVRAQVLT